MDGVRGKKGRRGEGEEMYEGWNKLCEGRRR